MRKHKIDINNTKYRKLIMTEHKTDINIKKLKNTKN